jgi:lysylphosphatidylglycerol synthetase-like protein (DUF2156 family)
MVCTKIKLEVYLRGIIIQLIIKQLIFKYFIYMISIKKIMSVIAIAFAVMTIAGSGVLANAQIADPCAVATTVGCGGNFSGFFKVPDNAKGTAGVAALIGTIGSFLIGIIAAVSVLFLILGAFDMVSDSGDGKKFANGKQRITNAIIGLVVALLAFGIISFIVNFVGRGNA